MTEKTTQASGASHEGSLTGLEDLVRELTRVDILGESEAEGGLQAEFRVELQDLVISEMSRNDGEPDLKTVLAEALARWAPNQ